MKFKTLLVVVLFSVLTLPSTGYSMSVFKLLTGKKNVVEPVTPSQGVQKEKKNDYSSITNTLLGMCAKECAQSWHGKFFDNCMKDSGFVEAEDVTFFYKKHENEGQNIRSFKWSILEPYADLVNPEHENVLPAKKGTFKYNVVMQRNSKTPRNGFVLLDEGTRCENARETNGHGYMDCETMVSEEYFQRFMKEEKK